MDAARAVALDGGPVTESNMVVCERPSAMRPAVTFSQIHQFPSPCADTAKNLDPLNRPTT
jgi:hypothetical protein